MNNTKSILHLINQSPFSNNAFSNCLKIIKDDDAVILFNDGVYAAINDTEHSKLLTDFVRCYAVYEDITTRGIEADKLIPHVKLIDYSEFVELSCEYSLSQSWY